ncbi:hypothetical protein BHE74_00019451 [Ensete ventricosum]|nr:hypothetical protein BHE74_00019451 [Ensete ventricosum]
MAAIEGRRRAAKLVSRLRLQSKRGAAARGRVAAAASSSCEKEVAEITEGAIGSEGRRLRTMARHRRVRLRLRSKRRGGRWQRWLGREAVVERSSSRGAGWLGIRRKIWMGEDGCKKKGDGGWKRRSRLRLAGDGKKVIG